MRISDWSSDVCSSDLLQVSEAGPGDAAGRAEMMQQRLLASGADPGDLVQRIAAQRLGPACPMGLDREPVGLVAQSLEKVQHRVAPLQQIGRASCRARVCQYV